MSNLCAISRFLLFCLVLLSMQGRGGAQDLPSIPLEEALRPPGPERLASLADLAQSRGWADLSPVLSDAALLAYENGQLDVSLLWLNLARWARLLGEPEAEFIQRWMRRVEGARLAHANMPRSFTLRPRVALATSMSRGVQAELAGDAAFLDEFFSQISPFDFLPGVLGILDELRSRNAEDCRDYPSLALAIALVYDVPPPPDWPHGQVSAALLPRKLPAPAATLSFFADEDRSKRYFHSLKKLGADELKFLVDVAASFDDLRWSRKVIDVPLAQFGKVYGLIRYRIDRARNNTPDWPSPAYTLPRILAEGGICVDQAYFACQVGKARGVPTLMFRGAGMDGRHAWFGYLDAQGVWQLDAGRYAEQRFVTGVALDPQTWGQLTDHALRFLAERFQSQLSGRRSRIHEGIAREYLERGMPEKAQAAARAAIRFERRNLQAYDTLSLVLSARAAAPKEREAVWREAIIAFQRYPDLEQRFTAALVESLRARGEKSQAEFEEKRLVRKYQGERADLSIRQSAQILSRSFAQDTLPQQIGAFNGVLQQYGKGAGMAFFDGIVVVFVEHLAQIGHPAEALKALERARTTLRVEKSSQLEQEFERVKKRIRNS